MRPTETGQAKIAYFLSLWPLALFIFSLAVTAVIAFTIVVNAEAFRLAVLTPFGLFVFWTINSPVAVIALASGLFGTVMGLGTRKWRLDERTTKIATRAMLFGLSSFAMYAFLFWLWFGFGR